MLKRKTTYTLIQGTVSLTLTLLEYKKKLQHQASLDVEPESSENSLHKSLKEKPAQIQANLTHSTKELNYYPNYDCQCDFSTLLHIQDCPHHPRGPTSDAPTSAFTKDLKMPNLLKQPEDC